MGKLQKSISVPLDFWNDVEKLLSEKKEILDVLRIRSASQLLIVLANCGRKPFLELLEGKKPMKDLL